MLPADMQSELSEVRSDGMEHLIDQVYKSWKGVAVDFAFEADRSVLEVYWRGVDTLTALKTDIS